MEMKKILSNIGNIILIFGVISGVILMGTELQTGLQTEVFSTLNIILGVAVIVISVFGDIVCEWLSQMLENAEEQTTLLSEQTKLLEEMKYKLDKKQ
jgi:hypothetical protein